MSLRHELISIIVPVYNVEKYLSECLFSVINQTYKEIEVIMVNDGSTDSSECICRQFLSIDRRLKLVCQKNMGLAAARNTGLKYANSDYICFIDADDVLHPDYIKVLFHIMQYQKADIAMCSYYKFQNDIPKLNAEVFSCVELDKYQMISNISTTGPNNSSESLVVTWNKLFNKKIFENMSFPNKLHEDEFMILSYIIRAKKVVSTNQVLYYYRQRPESIMGTKHTTNLRHLDVLDAVRSRIDYVYGSEYQCVLPMVLCSYFDNSIILYNQLYNSKNRVKLMKRIWPEYIFLLLHYRRFLEARQCRRFVLFLLSPKIYYKRFWNGR